MELNSSLNQLIADIRLTIRNGHIAETDNIDDRQIALWLKQYRAFLITQDIEKQKGKPLDPGYIQNMPSVPLQIVSESAKSKGCILETAIDLPKLLTLNNRSAIVSVTDVYGNVIQLGDRGKAKYQTSRKYTCNDYIAYQQGNKLRVEGPNLIDYVDIALLAEDPSALDTDCNFADQPYPIPADKIPVLKELIFQKELGVRLRVSSDVTNDSHDDLAGSQLPVSNRARQSAI